MKKILFVAAIVAVALSSCSKVDVVDSNLDNNVIGFGVYTGTSTKAAGESDVMTTEGLATAGFGVFTYYDLATQSEGTGATGGFDQDSSTPDFMYNTQVTGTESGESYTWSYSPMKYWPNNTNDVLSFFAYGPHSDNDSDANGISFDAVDEMVGVPVLTYTISDADAMVDFVVAAPVYDVQNTTDYNLTNSTISFEFKHLLTRASFDAYVDVTDFPDVYTQSGDDDGNTLETDYTKVFVNKMVIIGANGTTELVDKTNTVFAESSAGFYTSADFTYMAKDGTASEEDVEGVGSWDFDNATTNEDDFDFSDILDVATTAFGTYTPNGVDVGTTATPLFAGEDDEEKFLFLLPAGSTGIEAGTEMYVYIEYDVVTVDENLELGYSCVTNKDVITLTEGTLKPGYAYNYTLVIGLDEVTLSATVDEWLNDDDSYVVTPE
ncbi:MAG: fimbrillin family protein [Rikenellaceae bacterium]